MAKLVWILIACYAVYLCIGGLLFMHLEWEKEESVEIEESKEWKSLKEIILKKTEPENSTQTELLFEWLNNTCELLPDDLRSTLQQSGNGESIPADEVSLFVSKIEINCPNTLSEETNITYIYPWDFLDSVYFSMTVASTIGYGHLSPSTTWSRVACIIYATFGIPFTMTLLAQSSAFFGGLFFNMFTSKLDKKKQMSKIFIALGTVIYVAIGFVIFIFLPAVIFMLIEKWTYFEGVYYAFITLTTIGFGDFVTGSSIENKATLYIYQICVIIWIMCGLGYWVMVANFIIRAVKSKNVAAFAKKATSLFKLMNPSAASQIDPEFLLNNSKSSMVFMMQLSNALAMQASGSASKTNGLVSNDIENGHTLESVLECIENDDEDVKNSLDITVGISRNLSESDTISLSSQKERRITQSASNETNTTNLSSLNSQEFSPTSETSELPNDNVNECNIKSETR